MEVPTAVKSVLEKALTDEVRRAVLREAEDRYRNELLEDDECQLLLHRIKRLRSQPKLVTTS
jgi:hypothetical protein